MLSVGKELIRKTMIGDSGIVCWGGLVRILNTFSYQDTASINTSLLMILASKFPDQNSFLNYKHILKCLIGSMPEESHKYLKINMFKSEQYLFHSSLLFLLYSQFYWRHCNWCRSPSQEPGSPSTTLFHLSVQLNYVNFNFKCLKLFTLFHNQCYWLHKRFLSSIFWTLEMTF